MHDALQTLERNGYVVVPAMLSRHDAVETEQALLSAPLHGAGTRNLLKFPWCQALAQRIRKDPTATTILPRSSVAVQCTLFDKIQGRNWLVALHQDLSIPVRDWVDHPLLTGWSHKEGQHFVQPPEQLLEQLLAVRIHLDDCELDNGPLRVVPGSHRQGRLSEDAASQLRDEIGEVVCTLKATDALLMRPLILHASSKAKLPSQRRVLHFLFAPPQPGYGLQWNYAVH